MNRIDRNAALGDSSLCLASHRQASARRLRLVYRSVTFFDSSACKSVSAVLRPIHVELSIRSPVRNAAESISAISSRSL